MILRKLLSLAVSVGFLFFGVADAVHATAGVPKILSHQGRLLDASGNLLGGTGGTNYCFRFSLFDDSTIGGGDVQLWPASTPSTMTVSVKNGVYNVGIGDVTAGGDTLNYDFQSGDAAYLNIEVANSISGSCVGVSSFENLSPRQRVMSAGYAINSDTVDGFHAKQSADGNFIPALTSGNLILGATNPQINSTGSNALVLQGGAATGDVQFFSAANKVALNGDFTFAGTGTLSDTAFYNCSTKTNGGKLTVNASGTVICDDDIGAGSGTVTSIDASGGTTGLSFSGGPVTTSGTLTLGGTLGAANGGTGLTSYTVGDILYASGPTAFTKLGVGSDGQVLKVAGSVPTWGTDNDTTYTAGTGISISLGNVISNTGVVSEADTLASVTGRGATTSTASSFNGGASVRGLTVDSATGTNDKILVAITTVGGASFNGTITNADLTAARTYTLPDITGTFIVTGSAAGGDLTGTYPNPTIAADAVALGTDTTGNYVASVSGSGPISVSGSGEGAAVTVSCPTCLVSGGSLWTLAGSAGSNSTISQGGTATIAAGSSKVTTTGNGTGTVSIDVAEANLNLNNIGGSLDLSTQTTGTINLTTQVTGVLPIANGGTNNTTYTTGKFVAFDGTKLASTSYDNTSFAAASHTHATLSSGYGIVSFSYNGGSAASVAVDEASLDIGNMGGLLDLSTQTTGTINLTSQVTGILPIANGGSNTDGTGFTANRILAFDGTSFITTSLNPANVVSTGTAAGGDLTGIYPNPTVAADAVALGTDTTGNYVAGVSGSGPISVTGTGEGANVSVSCPTCLTTSSSSLWTLAASTGSNSTIAASGTATIAGTSGRLTSTNNGTGTVTLDVVESGLDLSLMTGFLDLSTQTTGTINLTSQVTGILPIANGGTNNSTFTPNTLTYFDGTSIVSTTIDPTDVLTTTNLSTYGVTSVTAGNGLTGGGGPGAITIHVGAGNGIAVAANDVSVDATTTGTTATTSSNSGIESTSTGIRLLGGCADTEILKWNAGTSTWDCSVDANAGSQTVRETDGSPSLAASTIEFGPTSSSDDEFVVTNEGGGVARVRTGTKIPRTDVAATISGGWTFNSATSFTSTIDATGATFAGATPLIFEGGTVDAFQTAFAITDPTASNTITFPDASGTVAVSASGPISLSAAGNISCPTCLVSGGSLWTSAGDVGSFAVSQGGTATFAGGLGIDTSASGSTVTFAVNEGALDLNNIGGFLDLSTQTTGTINLTTQVTGVLPIANGGTNNTAFTANRLTYFDGTKIASTTIDPANVLVTGGNLFATAADSGTSTIAQGDTVTFVGGTDIATSDDGAGNITIDDTSTLASVTGRGATTTTASSFNGGASVRGLTVDSATATNDRILTSITTIGGASFDGTITNADLTAARTYTLPDASGTFAVSASGPISLSAAGNISCSSCVTSSTTLFTLAGTSGSNQTITSGDTVTIAAGSNVTTTGGATDTVTVAVVANPSFTSVTSDTFDSSSSTLNLGPTNATTINIGNAGSTTNIFGTLVLDGDFNPSLDNTYELGTASLRWKDVWVGPGSYKLSSTTGTGGSGANYTLGTLSFSGTDLVLKSDVVGAGTQGSLRLTTASNYGVVIGPAGEVSVGFGGTNLGAGIVHTDAFGVLSSSGLDLTSEVGSSILPIANGGSNTDGSTFTPNRLLSYDGTSFVTTTIDPTTVVTTSSTGVWKLAGSTGSDTFINYGDTATIAAGSTRVSAVGDGAGSVAIDVNEGNLNLNNIGGSLDLSTQTTGTINLATQTSGFLDLTTQVTGVLPIANGGTNNTTYTTNRITYFDGTKIASTTIDPSTVLTSGSTLFNTAGDTGTSAISSGDTLTFIGGTDVTTTDDGAGNVTFDDTSTLASVTGRGATTSTTLTLTGGATISGGVDLSGAILAGTTPLVFDGTTVDANTTALSFVDPTGSNVITFPDASGYVLLSGGALYTLAGSTGPSSTINQGGTATIAGTSGRVSSTSNGSGTITLNVVESGLNLASMGGSLNLATQTSGQIDLTTQVTGVLPIANGGSNSSGPFVSGELLSFDGTSFISSGVATADVVTSGTAAGGDLTGFYPNPTVAANAVALGTDTTGSYVATVAGSGPISVSGSGGEGANVSVSCPTCVVTGGTLLTLAGSTGSNQTISQGDTITIAAGSSKVSTVGTATDTVSIDVNEANLNLNNIGGSLDLSTQTTGTINLATQVSGVLPIANGGTNNTGFTTNRLVYFDGTQLTSTTINPADVLLSGGSLFDTAGDTGTSTINQGGTLTFVGGTDITTTDDGSGNVTFDDASTLASVTGRGATTTTASSFNGGASVRGLTVDSSTATNDRILTSITTIGGASFDGTITNADLTAARTYTLPNASGTFAVSASTPISLSAAGNISCPTCLVSGGSLFSSQGDTGTSSISQGGTLKVAGGSNISTADNGSGIITVATSANPSFTSVTSDTLDSSSTTLDIGPTNATTINIGSGSSTTNIFGTLVLDGGFNPAVDNTYDLGSPALRWKTVYVGPGSYHLTSTTGTGGSGTNYTDGSLAFGGTNLKLATAAVGAGATGTLQLTTGSNTGVNVDSSGNVGVGTTSPTELLSVGSGSDFTVDNAGNVTASGDAAIDGGNVTTTAATGNLFSTNASTVNLGDAADTVNLAGGSGSTGCTIDLNGNFSCSGSVSGGGTVGGSGAQYHTTVWTSNTTLGDVGPGTSGQLLISQGGSAYPAYTSMSGDATINGSGVVTISSNAVALGTDTTGNYVANVTATGPIQISGTPGEGWTPDVSCPTCVTTSSTGIWTLAGSTGSSTSINFGDTATIAAGSSKVSAVGDGAGSVAIDVNESALNLNNIGGSLDLSTQTTGTISLTSQVSGILPIANGGTNNSSFTANRLTYFDGTKITSTTINPANVLLAGGSLFTTLGDTGTSTISQGGSLKIAGGSNITTTDNGSGIISVATVNNPTFSGGLTVSGGNTDLTGTVLVGANPLVFEGAVVDGNTTTFAFDEPTGTNTITFPDASGSVLLSGGTLFTLAGSSGSNSTISQGGTATIAAGSSKVSTTGNGTGTVSIDVNEGNLSLANIGGSLNLATQTTGLLSLTTQVTGVLPIANGGTNNTSFTANRITYFDGTKIASTTIDPSTVLTSGSTLFNTAGDTGTSAISSGDTLTFVGGTDVTTTDDGAGNITFDNTSTLASVTGRGATTSTASSFNGGASVRGLTVDSATGTNDKILTSITTVGGASFNGTITNADLTAARTYTLPNASGTFAVSASAPITLSAAGDIGCSTCVVTGGNLLTLAGSTGSNQTISQGDTITIAAGSSKVSTVGTATDTVTIDVNEGNLSLANIGGSLDLSTQTTGTIDLTTQVSGILPIANGGTNADGSAYTANRLLAYDGTSFITTSINPANVVTTGNIGSSAVTSVTAGSGLTGGGGPGAITIDVGAGNGIAVAANDVSVDATTSGTTATTSSNSGIESTSTGIRLLGGCANNEILKWNSGASTWGCSSDATGGTVNSFETWSTPSGTSPVADSSTDTVTFTAGTGMVVTGNAGTDSIDFAVNESALDLANIGGFLDLSTQTTGTIDLTTQVSGILPIANGGTNSSSFTTNRLTYFDGTSIVSTTINPSNVLLAGGSLFTLAATTGSNSTISQGGTATIAAGSNITTTNNGSGTVTVATVASPSFTSVSTSAVDSATTLDLGASSTTINIGNAGSTTNIFGTLNLDGDFAPAVDNTYELGLEQLRWKDVWVGPGSYKLSSTTGTSGSGTDYTLGSMSFNGTEMVLKTEAVGTGSIGSVRLTTDTNGGVTVDSSGTFATHDATELGDAATDGITLVGEVRGASPIRFEGATNDNTYTTIAVVDPTAARTINVPNASGTFAVSASAPLSLSAAGNLTCTTCVTTSSTGVWTLAGSTGSSTSINYGDTATIAAGSSKVSSVGNGTGTVTIDVNEGNLNLANIGGTINLTTQSTGTIDLTTQVTGILPIANGGTNNSSFTTNRLTYFDGTSIVSTSINPSNVLLAGGNLFTAAATTGSNSTIAQGGTLTLAAGTDVSTTNNGTGTITIADTSTLSSVTGRGASTSTALSLNGGATVRGETIDTATATDDLIAVSVTAGGAARFTGTITAADLTGSNKTYTLPNASGTFAVSASAPITLSAAGDIGCSTCVVSGGNLLTLAGSTGSNQTISQGDTITIAAGSSRVSTVGTATDTVTIDVNEGNLSLANIGGSLNLATQTTGTISLTSQVSGILPIANGGTNNSSFTTNRLTYFDGTSIVSTTINPSNVLLSGGSLYTLAGTSGSSSTISQGGTATIAAGTDISTTGNGSGTVTVADTSTLSSVTGRGATTSTAVSLNGGATVRGATVDTATATDDLIAVSVTAGGAARFTGTITAADLTGSNKTYTLPNASGTFAVSASAPITLSAAGDIGCSTCVVSGGNLYTLAGTSGSSSTIAQGGTATIAAGTNMTTTGNGSGTVTVATVANPTFTTSVTTPTVSNGVSGITVGSASGTTTITSSNWGVSSAGAISGLTGISSSGTVTLSGLTANRFVTTDGSSNLTTSQNSAALANTLTDETGTGVAVFGTSPAITTSLTTGSTSFDLLNTTATTVNFAGAATTLAIGASTGTATINNATVNLQNGVLQTGGTQRLSNGGALSNITGYTQTSGVHSVTMSTTNSATFASNTGNTDVIAIKPQTTGTGATFTGTITSADLTGTDKTWTFPDASGTVAVSASAPISLSAAGNISCSTCVVSGGNLYTLAGTSGSSSTIAQGGTATIAAGTNMTTTGNGSGTVTVATVANPTFTTSVTTPTVSNGASGITVGSGTGTTTISSSNWNVSSAGAISGLTGISSSGTVTLSGLTANRFVTTDGSSNLTTSQNSAALANTLTDETGTGVAVFGTSPAITTSLTTGSTSFDLLNTTATTVNFAGAATTLAIGASTGTATINNATVTLANATTVNVNGASPSIVTSSTGTASVFNTNALTGNLFGAASTINVGPASTTATSIKFGGGAGDTGCTIFGATGNLTCDGTISGTFAVKWSDLQNPTANESLSMGANTSLFTYNAATGANVNLYRLVDTASNTGTGYIFSAETAASSAAKPFRAVAQANTIIDTTSTGGVTIGNATAAQPVTVDAGTATLNVGNSNNAKTINIGTGTAVDTIHIGDGGTGADVITIGSNVAGQTLTLDAGTGAAAIAIGNSATAHGIQIGTGAAAQTVSIGSTNSTSGTTISAGSNNLALTATSGSVNLSTTTSGTINFQPLGSGSTGIVQVGAGGSGSTTPDFFAVDVSSSGFGSGNPTGGANGYMYYNTSSNKFRCFENGAWKDCDTNSGGAPRLDQIIAATATNTIANANFAQTWNWGTLTTQTGMTFGGGTAMTTGSVFALGGGTYVHTGTNTETGSLTTLSVTDASSNTGGNPVTNGMLITPTFNTTASAGAKVLNGLKVDPTLTACGTTGGTCTLSDIALNTPALTQTTTNTMNLNALSLGTAGALVQNTAAGTINWNGLNLQMPNITQTTGTVTSTGLKITGGTVTSGTSYALTTSSSAGNVGIGTTTPTRTLDVNGNMGGGSDTNTQSLTSTQTVNDATKAVTFYLQNDSGTTNSDVDITYNLTGLPDVDGTYAFFYLQAKKGATTNAHVGTVDVSINSTAITNAVVKTANTTGASTVDRNFTLIRVNGAWRLIGSTGDSSGGVGSGQTIKYKPADETRTSTTTLSNDADLYWNVGANEVWSGFFAIEAFTTSNSPDLNISVTAPSGATCDVSYSLLNLPSAGAEANLGCGVRSAQIALSASTEEIIFISVNIENGATAGPVNLQWSQDTSNGTAVRFRQGSYTNAFRVTGADVAEGYYTTDDSMGAGDVVALNPSVKAGIVKTTSAYDANTLGVVTSMPGLVLGDGLNSQRPEGSRTVYMALAGRVPVKVSDENGAIAAGDFLTASSTPGVAMKATKAGPVVGRALESWNGQGFGAVTMIISPAQQSGITTRAADATKTFAQEDADILASLAAPAEGQSTAELNVDRVVAGLSVISNQGLFNGLKVDSIGSLHDAITLASDTIFIGRPYFNSDTAGFAVITPGDSSVNVTFDKPYETTPVVSATLSFDGDAPSDWQNIRYVVTNKSVNGFTIQMYQPTGADVKFSWIALAVKDARTAKSNGTTTAVSAPEPSAPPAGDSGAGSDPAPEAAPSAPSDSSADSGAQAPAVDAPSDTSSDTTSDAGAVTPPADSGDSAAPAGDSASAPSDTSATSDAPATPDSSGPAADAAN